MRISIPIEVDAVRFREQLYHWAATFPSYCFLDGSKPNSYTYPSKPRYDFLAGIDSIGSITPDQRTFEEVQAFAQKHQDWCFGHFTYDLKNELENLQSNHPDRIGFTPAHFFCPRWVIACEQGNWRIEVFPEDAAGIPDLVERILQTEEPIRSHAPVKLEPAISREAYLKSIQKLQQHIQRGDIYEANFCQEFVGEAPHLDTTYLWKQLQIHSPAPFSALYRLNEHYLLCASPERFVRKVGERLESQPIKGTSRRGSSPREDEELKAALVDSIKERSENVMIVDLVRNDLSHHAQPGSVVVDELFGTYSFPTVHQLISTVSCRLRSESTGLEAVRDLFPMGSMTGAPKIRAMELIEETESFQRGLYSGTVGYIDPNGDFDFNVVIRSLLYNATTQQVSVPVGGAITALSNPEQEYEESLLKAQAIRSLLAQPR